MESGIVCEFGGVSEIIWLAADMTLSDDKRKGEGEW